MTDGAIFAPMCAFTLLIAAVWARLGYVRISSAFRGAIRMEYIRVGTGEPPAEKIVAARVVHTAIVLTSNRPQVRVVPFFLSSLAVWGLWLLVLQRVALAASPTGVNGAHANLGLCAGIEHDASRAHVQLDVDHPPNVAFYPTRALEGPPALRLSERGLVAVDQLLCSWPDGGFGQTPEPNRVLGSSPEAPCPPSPVKSAFGDHGTGTAVLCIELIRHADGLAQTEFRGAPLYFSLGSLPAGRWGLEPPSQTDAP